MKNAKPTILILTTHTGGGHLNLAQALKSMLETHHDIVIMNPQSGLVERYYAFVSRHFLKFLHWQYYWTDNKFASLWLQRIVTLFDHGRIASAIEQVQPRLIITTHALLSYAAARANKRRRKHIPLIFQLTDLEQLHMTWFSEKGADAYFAPTREIFTQAQKQGIDKSRLHLTGRPVRRQFWEADVEGDARRATLETLGLDPTRFTLFLQGGAKGSAGVDQTIECLLGADVPVQIILAAGNNHQMVARYADAERVRALPFTEKIAPYMAASDVIAGKAGASFVSEAFTLGKPFLVTAFIPGQETPTLRFITRHNLGWICLETMAQRELLTQLARNPALLAEKVDAIQAYRTFNKGANQEICSIIERLLSDNL